MAFTSFTFLLFLAVTVSFYLLLPHRFRAALLLLASLVFYGFYAWWAPLFILSFTAVIFFAALGIKRSNKKGFLLLITVAGLLLALYFVLRYSDLIKTLIASLTAGAGDRIRLVFPLGFSYYLFKSLGYLIDVYRETLEPERHFGHLLLYTAYFPEISLGPITAASDFLPQIDRVKPFSSRDLSAGFFMVVWGFFKKLVFADRLALVIAPYYGRVSSLDSGLAWFLVSFAYFIQLYLDFSGYTDISVGVSKMLGYEIKHNFNAPLVAQTMSEYWRRWHMSLYEWFSAYIFKPLQFSWRRLGRYASALAAFVTLTISGIWHDAAPGFLIWGILMGLCVAFDALFAKRRKKLKKKLPGWLFVGSGILATLLINTLVLAFTRAASARDAFFILGRIFDFKSWPQGLPAGGLVPALLLGLAATAASHILEWKRPALADGLEKMPLVLRWGILQLMLMALILFAAQGADMVGGFIYARF